MANYEFGKMCAEMELIVSRKSNDYASEEDPYSNFRECEKMGIPAWKGVVVRMNDKMSRINQLSSGKERQVEDEPLEETFLDLAIYALHAIILRREVTTNEN